MNESEFHRRNRIRKRDKYHFKKNGGIIPKGFEMHHLWYSDWYTDASFVIVSHEEHVLIHHDDKVFIPSDQYEYPESDEYIPVDEKDSPLGEYGEI